MVCKIKFKKGEGCFFRTNCQKVDRLSDKFIDKIFKQLFFNFYLGCFKNIPHKITLVKKETFTFLEHIKMLPRLDIRITTGMLRILMAV